MLEIERIYDNETYRSVICHPEIFQRVAAEFQDSKDVVIPSDHVVLAGKVDGEVIGITNYERFHIDSLLSHFAVLPNYRRHAYRFGKKSLEWAWRNIPRACIVTMIPDKFQNTIKFGNYLGMKEAGRIPKAVIYDKKLHDVVLLAINNPELQL